jgi:HlyD family secretion protein
MPNQQSEPKGKKKNSRNHRLKRAIIIAVAVIVVGGIAWAKFSGNDRSTEEEALFALKRGDLRISVVESGKIKASRSVNLLCEVEGQSTIISIVPEGTYVKEGDVLVELDSANLRDSIAQNEITVKSAEAAFTQSSEAYEIQKNQNESNIKTAELARDFAKIDLEKYLEGDWPQQLRKADNDITTANSDLKLKQRDYEGMVRLEKKQYVTQTDLQRAEFDFELAQIKLKQAEDAKKLLEEYDHKKQLAKLTADYQESEKELERAKRRAASQIAQAEADKGAKEATFGMQKTRLNKLKDQLNKTTMKAPQPGLVVYGSSTGEQFRRSSGLIAEGEKVYERQKLIELPDISTMKVDVNVHESVRDIIKPNQQAIITVEALPGATFWGHVEKVAILPNSEQRWMSPDLTVYTTSVKIDDKAEALKPGMTAKVEIIVADLQNVLYAPLQAVTVRSEREVCYVAKGSKVVVTPVQVGLSNDNYIEIKSGLKEGDKVLTYAPITMEREVVAGKSQKPEPGKQPPPQKEQPAGPTKPGEQALKPGEQAPKPGEEASKPGEERPRQMSAEMQEKMKAFLQNLSPEQKQEIERRLKEAGVEQKIDWENLTPENMREIGRQMRAMRPPQEGQGGTESGPFRRGPRTDGQGGTEPGSSRRGPRPEGGSEGGQPGGPGQGTRQPPGGA